MNQTARILLLAFVALSCGLGLSVWGPGQSQESKMHIYQEAAVGKFLKEARSYQKQRLSARQVMQEVIQSYRNNRITGAKLEEGGDMLLFQWGVNKPWLLMEPIDLRKNNDDELKKDSRDLPYLDFTRQVFVSNGKVDADFDEAAIQMSITFIYESATGKKQKASDMWIGSPDEVEAQVKQYGKNAFVTRLLDAVPTRIIATVDNCG